MNPIILILIIAKIIATLPNNGLCENRSITKLTIPNPGKINIYTSG